MFIEMNGDRVRNEHDLVTKLLQLFKSNSHKYLNISPILCMCTKCTKENI